MRRIDLKTGMLVRFRSETGYRVVMRNSMLAGNLDDYICGFRDGDANDMSAYLLSDYDVNMLYINTTVADPSLYDIVEVATVRNFSAVFRALKNNELISTASTFKIVWHRGDEDAALEIKSRIEDLKAQIIVYQNQLEQLRSGVDLVE